MIHGFYDYFGLGVNMKSKLARELIHILSEYPETRNDDKKLMNRYYKVFFPHEFTKEGYAKPDYIERVTNPDHIVRVRAIIQNENGLYLPTDPKVRKQRKQSTEAWKAWCRLSRSPRKLSNLTGC